MKSDEKFDWTRIKNLKISPEKKERILILILLGIFFLLIATPVSSISNFKNKKNTTKKNTNIKIEKNEGNNAYINVLENKLEQTIEGIEGAGNVLVMITLKDNGEKILDKNKPYESEVNKNKEEGKESEKNNIKREQETVLIETDGNTTPIIIQEMYPEIEGVVVVCDGGDNPALCIHIKEVVKALFSVDTHKIVVCKLKHK